MGTAHPLFRLPVFLMGVLGGLQVLQAHSDWENFEDPNLHKNLLHTFIPWSCVKTKCSSKTKNENAIVKNSPAFKEKSMKTWKRRVDFSSLFYIGILSALCITNAIQDIYYGCTEGILGI